MRDVIDYQFATADEDLALLVARSGHVREVRTRSDGALGLRFRNPAFDGITWCNNKCPFCFVKMNPAGGRTSLYVKDDDYRYSALYGNFVTLTNLTEEDWRRIDAQRLSPLYVSVHATDPTLRRRLLGNPTAPPILGQLDRLAAMGIAFHTQAVLCPEMNDGQELDETIDAIARRHPAALSLSLVPLGLTGRGRFPAYLRRHTLDEAAAIVDRAAPYRRRFRAELGHTFLYPSDEFYLMGGRTIPPARHYHGYEQYQNGVGMVRSLLEEWRARRPYLRPVRPGMTITVVTGELAAGVLAPILEQFARMTEARIDLVVAQNLYFGRVVTVAGLLTAGDIERSLADRTLGEIVVLPRATLDTQGERFLDDVTPPMLEDRLGRPVRFAEHLRDLLTIMSTDVLRTDVCAA
ncbi:MAG: DUF512 domain-containing protein [Chloroflexi bacterium]|nr:DUF512 domain-containing protein [Chloroflexota bacterium]